MIRDFDQWSTNLVETFPLQELRNSCIAIEAAHYLAALMRNPPTKEPLLSALGGLPFTMKAYVQYQLNTLRGLNITPIFVFSGMDVGNNDITFAESEEAIRVNADAWTLYNNQQPQQAVDTFGNSNAVRPEDMFRYLQSLLREEGVAFQVAPYSAWAQLAYLEKNPKQYIDAIVGSSEILMYDVEKVITNLDYGHQLFTAIKRRSCIADLGNISPEIFVDACMLAGSQLLPTLPQLNNSPSNSRKAQQSKIRGAVDMILNTNPRSGHAVCLNYQDDPTFRQLNYLDRYRKARLSVKHHVVLTSAGKVEPFDVQHAPSDVHTFIGQRLPEEIYYYLSKGVIGPRVLNWRASSEIIEQPPLDGGESEEYRMLVRDKLTDMRTSAIALLSFSLHNWYQHKTVTHRCWFDGDNARTISTRDVEDPRPLIKKWNVKSDIFAEKVSSVQDCGPLGFTVRTLQDADFAAKTVTDKNTNKPLSSKGEILYNSLWRFLQLRGFLDAKHQLTAWGKVLSTTMSSIGGRAELEEPAMVAVELLRLGLLNANTMFHTYSGAPFRGNEIDKTNVLLISRVACLGKLQHRSIGFTGPLSRHLLGYHSITTAVRNGLRDLAEVSLTTLLASGDAIRDRKDLSELGLELPFLLDNDCALGIAVKSYLDELVGCPDPRADESKSGAVEKGQKEWLPHAEDLEGDLNIAFVLWDAVYAGVKQAGSLVKDRKLFDNADDWLKGLRT